MAELNSLRIDQNKANDGVWEPYGGTDFECKIARTGNQRYQQEVTKLRQDRRVRRALSSNDINERQQALAPLIAKYILVDWRGLTSKGKEVPYSEAKAAEMLASPDFQDLFLWVVTVSGDGELYRVDLEEDDQGNLSNASNGTSDTVIQS